jgi:hypothetical protein
MSNFDWKDKEDWKNLLFVLVVFSLLFGSFIFLGDY